MNVSEELLAEVISIRKDIHQYPELSGEEYRTTEVIKSFLKERSIPILPLDLATGVVAEIGKEGPIIALRADIDALPITESTQLPYQSKVQGVMHACGHDFHTASLLGAAAILKEREEELKGRIRLIFQPAEEQNLGARQVIEVGALEGVEQIIGYHNKPDLPIGTIGLKSGHLMAAVDQFEVIITGVGTHAAAPHNGNDPLVTASQIVTSLQTIVSRHVSPLDTVVVSVTKIDGGNTWNVIPESVVLKGTIRTFKEDIQQKTKQLFEQIVTAYAGAVNQKSEIIWVPSPPSVHNDLLLTEQVKEAVSIFADIIEPEVTLGGEDFAFYQQEIPGIFAFIGTGAPYEWHHPNFLVQDKALVYAIQYYFYSATHILNHQRATSKKRLTKNSLH